MDPSNLLSGLIGALLGSLASIAAVMLDHSLRSRSEQKRTLNSLLRELGSVRRTLDQWADRRRGDWSWKEGGPLGIRPSLKIVERLPVEVSELPTEVTRLVESVERKLAKFHAACQEEFQRRMTSESPAATIPENEPGLQRVVGLAEQAVGEIRLAEKACTAQWDEWQVPIYKRKLRLRRVEANYQGPRRLPGYDTD